MNRTDRTAETSSRWLELLRVLFLTNWASQQSKRLSIGYLYRIAGQRMSCGLRRAILRFGPPRTRTHHAHIITTLHAPSTVCHGSVIDH